MSTSAHNAERDASEAPPPAPPAPPAPPDAPTDATRIVPDAAEAADAADEPALPPALSGKSFLRRGVARWAVTGTLRVGYRLWTRIAVRLFPEDSRRAALATTLGIPLPDRLNLSWVTPQLAVGGRVARGDIPRLAAIGVTRVVDTRSERKDDVAALLAAGITLLYLPTQDTFPLSIAQLREGAEWINAQLATGQRVLIHCEHGVGRSVLLTAAALVVNGSNAHDAMRLIRRRRWQAAPNHRQMRRLQEFEHAVHGQVRSQNA